MKVVINPKDLRFNCRQRKTCSDFVSAKRSNKIEKIDNKWGHNKWLNGVKWGHVKWGQPPFVVR